jgi:hypothetical protein
MAAERRLLAELAAEQAWAAEALRRTGRQLDVEESRRRVSAGSSGWVEQACQHSRTALHAVDQELCRLGENTSLPLGREYDRPVRPIPRA